ncbi:MAG: leucine-rich repeat domain-containing protein, partial [Hungatella sp.]
MNGTDTNIPNSSSTGSEPNNNDGLVIKNGILEQCVTRNRSVAVPSGVHTIGKGAFKGCTSLEQILLPDTVTLISDDAFKGCRKLAEITLPDRLDTIGSYAFHRCHSLTAITIPASVKALGNCVFLYCDSLETVNMPGVQSLGLQTFLNDVRLRRILISPELDIQ